MSAGFGHDEALVLLALLAVSAALVAVAPTLRVPYPILLVLGGLALGWVPGMPRVELSPELVLFGVLPPLLYAAAFFTPLRELRANVRPISLLSIGLVLATTVTVATVAHEWVDDLSWPAAFVLGALVSPTDPLAATAIAQRLGVPRRIVAVIEGESLVNDATALVAYRFAVAAVLTGSFSLAHATVQFLVNVAGGIAIGLGIGYVIRQVRKRLDNPPAEIAISLLTGYFAYLPAEVAGVSAVLAAVSAGVYLGWHTPELTTVQVRLQGDAVWRILQFVLNALLFILVGLQLSAIVDSLAGTPTWRLVGYAVLVTGTVILTRVAWIFPATYLPRLLVRRIRERDPSPPWQHPAVIAWSGLRGAVTLAAALALPLRTDSGTPFPHRDLIVFLAFQVILGTLVVQGLTLPFLIHLLGLEDDGLAEKEEAKARIHAAEAALARLEQLVDEDWVRADTAERLRGLYGFRADRFRSRFDAEGDASLDERSLNFQRLRRELLEAERQSLHDLRRERRIDDDVMRRIEYDLDLESARLEPEAG